MRKERQRIQITRNALRLQVVLNVGDMDRHRALQELLSVLGVLTWLQRSACFYALDRFIQLTEEQQRSPLNLAEAARRTGRLQEELERVTGAESLGLQHLGTETYPLTWAFTPTAKIHLVVACLANALLRLELTWTSTEDSGDIHQQLKALANQEWRALHTVICPGSIQVTHWEPLLTLTGTSWSHALLVSGSAERLGTRLEVIAQPGPTKCRIRPLPDEALVVYPQTEIVGLEADHNAPRAAFDVFAKIGTAFHLRLLPGMCFGRSVYDQIVVVPITRPPL